MCCPKRSVLKIGLCVAVDEEGEASAPADLELLPAFFADGW
jgi:hypothetical protein